MLERLLFSMSTIDVLFVTLPAYYALGEHAICSMDLNSENYIACIA